MQTLQLWWYPSQLQLYPAQPSSAPCHGAPQAHPAGAQGADPEQDTHWQPALGKGSSRRATNGMEGRKIP